MTMKLNQEHIETHVPWLIILVLLVVSVGGLVEIVPLFFQGSLTQPVASGAHRPRHLCA
jgi:cytochrome c oxidase cbb3-type subunit II